jgi:hypothetical protein
MECFRQPGILFLAFVALKVMRRKTPGWVTLGDLGKLRETLLRLDGLVDMGCPVTAPPEAADSDQQNDFHPPFPTNTGEPLLNGPNEEQINGHTSLAVQDTTSNEPVELPGSPVIPAELHGESKTGLLHQKSVLNEMNGREGVDSSNKAKDGIEVKDGNEVKDGSEVNNEKDRNNVKDGEVNDGNESTGGNEGNDGNLDVGG